MGYRGIKITAAAVLLVSLGLMDPRIASAEPQREESAPVLATTGWTAAFARAAGLSEVGILAPYELPHPAEYELKPSDLRAIAEADLIIYAGYENMVRILKDVTKESGDKLLQIRTDFRLFTLKESISKIASVFGTNEHAEKSIKTIAAMYEDWRNELRKASLLGAPVLVHLFQKPLAMELGFEVKGVFGPTPIEARQIVALSQESVRLIIDNGHNPAGIPLKETLPMIPYALFINFPAARDNGSLLDVLNTNRRALEEALSSSSE
jgi:zinc transport system substrate-binding protein